VHTERTYSHTTIQHQILSWSFETSHRTYRCSRSCFAVVATAARRARHAPDEGDDGGDVRGSTTTTVDARILLMPNSRTMRETSLPPPSLGISRGAPPSRRGGKEAEEEEEAPLVPTACCGILDSVGFRNKLILPWNDLIPTCVPRNRKSSAEFRGFRKMRPVRNRNTKRNAHPSL
jgi:hypothetical protein